MGRVALFLLVIALGTIVHGQFVELWGFLQCSTHFIVDYNLHWPSAHAAFQLGFGSPPYIRMSNPTPLPTYPNTYYEYDVCIYGYNNSEEPDLVLYFTFRHRKAYSNVCDPFGSDCNHYIRAAGLDVWLEDDDSEISRLSDTRCHKLTYQYRPLSIGTYRPPAFPSVALGLNAANRRLRYVDDYYLQLLPFITYSWETTSTISIESAARAKRAVEGGPQLTISPAGEVVFTDGASPGNQEFEIKKFVMYTDLAGNSTAEQPFYNTKSAITIGVPKTNLYIVLPRTVHVVTPDGHWNENGNRHPYVKTKLVDFKEKFAGFKNSTVVKINSAEMNTVDDRVWIVEPVENSDAVLLNNANNRDLYLCMMTLGEKQHLVVTELVPEDSNENCAMRMDLPPENSPPPQPNKVPVKDILGRRQKK